MLLNVCLLFGIISVAFGQTPPPGSIRRMNNGVVQVYYNNEWPTICYDESTFSKTEADVICHQLGYTEAEKYSSTGQDSVSWTGNGTFTNVDCASSEYQVFFQCSYDQNGCNSDEVLTIECSSTSLSSDPFSGQVRLTAENQEYTNQGVVEIYCNSGWGTVCAHEGFGDTDADAICAQLGYNDVYSYDNITINNLPVWLDQVECGSITTCLSSCQSCPSSSQTNSCTTGEIVYIECSYDTTLSDNTQRTGSCDFTELVNAIGRLIGIIVGVIVGIIVCAVFWAVLPFCICCCLGVGVCAAASRA